MKTEQLQLFKKSQVRLSNGQFSTKEKAETDYWKKRALIAESKNRNYNELLLRYNHLITSIYVSNQKNTTVERS